MVSQGLDQAFPVAFNSVTLRIFFVMTPVIALHNNWTPTFIKPHESAMLLFASHEEQLNNRYIQHFFHLTLPS